MTCAICRFNVDSPKSIYTETLPDAEMPIYNFIENLASDTDYIFPDNPTICERCYDKLVLYQRALKSTQDIRNEILELLSSTATYGGFIEYSCLETHGNLEVGENSDFTAKMNEFKMEEDDLQIEYLSEGFIAEELEDNDIIIYEDDLASEKHTESEFATSECITIKKVEEAEMIGNYPNETSFANWETDKASSMVEVEIMRKRDSFVQCEQCGECFQCKRNLRSHIKRQHFPGYVCETCGKTLQSYSGFIGHVKNHSAKKNFECKECGLKFNRKFRLTHHMAWHSGEKPFECDICHKSFVHRIALYKHKLIHNEASRRIECTVCSFKFRTMAHLKRHMRSHTGDKPYECPVCKKTFSQMYNMKAHQRDHEQPGSSRQRRYHCNQCTRTFASKKKFDMHTDRKECLQLPNTVVKSDEVNDLPSSSLMEHVNGKKVVMLCNDTYES